MRAGELAVLEVNWEERVLKREISLSVHPFLHGLEGALDEDFPEGVFNSKEDLLEGLGEFKKSRAKYLYVGAHGLRKQIFTPDHGIYSQTIIDACKGAGSRGKGYFFSACDFVNRKTALEFLTATKAEFIAGYSGSIPWLDSMLVDLFFLTYLLQGRVKREVMPGQRGKAKGVSLREDKSGFIYEMSANPLKVARWVYEDVPLALSLGFDVFTLSRPQGRPPRLVGASAGWRSRRHAA